MNVQDKKILLALQLIEFVEVNELPLDKHAICTIAESMNPFRSYKDEQLMDIIITKGLSKGDNDANSPW